MAIVALVKVTLYAPAAEKDAVLADLQRLGCVHLNDLRAEPSGRELPAQSAEARAALQYLGDTTVQRRAVGSSEPPDVDKLVREVLEVRDRSQALAAEREQLEKWIADAEPWGSFVLPDWARDGELKFRFYVVPHYDLAKLEALVQPWRVVARDNGFGYVVVISAEEPEGVPGVPAELDPRPLDELKTRLSTVEREIEELDYRRIGLTLHRDTLASELDVADDLTARRGAARRVLERDALVAVQGWAPAERGAALRELAGTKGLALTIEQPGADDAPPTLLDNAPALRGGEDLLTFYTMPAYGAWDPSSAVLVAFAFFFAVIFADAGYALLLAGILGFLWKRLGTTAHNRSLRTMMLIVVVFSLVYGVIAGSYFGVTPAADSFLGTLHVLDTSDQALMMWLSIVVGAVHIVASNLVSSWRKRGRAAALGPFGWAAIIAGGACVGIGSSYPAFAVLATIGRASLVAGAALVLLFSSDRPFSFAPKQLFFRLVDGIKGATQLTKAFGDVLSYLRLFALGLAAFKLAEVFNGMAASAFEIKGVGVLLGVLILLIGHGLNFVMGIMSGVVHSLRLNLIEFLSWSLTEEGRPFAPFAKKANKQ